MTLQGDEPPPVWDDYLHGCASDREVDSRSSRSDVVSRCCWAGTRSWANVNFATEASQRARVSESPTFVTSAIVDFPRTFGTEYLRVSVFATSTARRVGSFRWKTEHVQRERTEDVGSPAENRIKLVAGLNGRSHFSTHPAYRDDDFLIARVRIAIPNRLMVRDAISEIPNVVEPNRDFSRVDACLGRCAKTTGRIRGQSGGPPGRPCEYPPPHRAVQKPKPSLRSAVRA
jgi:hypothetical protein